MAPGSKSRVCPCPYPYLAVGWDHSNVLEPVGNMGSHGPERDSAQGRVDRGRGGVRGGRGGRGNLKVDD